MTATPPPATLVTARLPDGRSLIADLDPSRTTENSPLQRALADATTRHDPRTANAARRTP
ncbi:hypothetical protein ACIPW9_36195 [Streptomyces sp. NPDC090052]|uniref:hypothetical protein n=1 Tax=Streptomyces sp. NPDC090052 TaxID=3365931 RepID=UPI0037F1F9EB